MKRTPRVITSGVQCKRAPRHVQPRTMCHPLELEGADFLAGRAHAVDGDTSQDIELMMDAALDIEMCPGNRFLFFSHAGHISSW